MNNERGNWLSSGHHENIVTDMSLPRTKAHRKKPPRLSATSCRTKRPPMQIWNHLRYDKQAFIHWEWCNIWTKCL